MLVVMLLSLVRSKELIQMKRSARLMDTITEQSFSNVEGPIYRSGTDLIISSCTFVSCYAAASREYHGGAIFSQHANLEVTMCTFTSCTAPPGGAGGCIACFPIQSETVKIQSNTFTKCTSFANASEARGYGGCITLGRATTTPIVLDSNVFRECAARRGGAIYSESDSDINITNSEFYDCVADRGGAIVGPIGPIVTISTSIFERCQSPTDGGCVVIALHTRNNTVAAIGQLIFTMCNVTEARSQLGSALMIFMTNVEIEKCMFSDCTAAVDGTVYVYACGTTVMHECSFDNCSASDDVGGFMSDLSSDSITVSACNFSKCKAADYASCISIWETSEPLTIRDCTFDDAVSRARGSIALQLLSQCEVIACTIRNSVAIGDSGSAIYVTGSELVSILSCVIEDCYSLYYGAICLVEGSKAVITSCDFIRDSASDGCGCLLVGENNAAIIDQCTFAECSSENNYGGGLIVFGSVSVTNSTIMECHSGSFGGFLCLIGETELYNCTITGCSSEQSYGGAVYSQGVISMMYLVVRDCSCASCGGFACLTGKGNMHNCIITGCSAGSDGGCLFTQDTFSVVDSVVRGCYCEVSGGCMCLLGDGDIFNCTITECSAEGDGGCIFTQERFSMIDSVVRGCHCEMAGGFMRILADGNICNCTITECSALSDGGCILAERTLFSMINSVITDCRCNEYGGFLCLSGEANLFNCIISNCSSGLSGGAISHRDSGLSLTVDLCHISKCVSDDAESQFGGGGIFSQSGVLKLSNSTIEGCVSAGDGGGLCLPRRMECGDVFIYNVSIQSCECSGRGGAIFCDRNVSHMSLHSFSSMQCRSTSLDANYNFVCVISIGLLDWASLCIPEQNNAVYCADPAVRVPTRQELTEKCPLTDEFKMYGNGHRHAKLHLRCYSLLFSYNMIRFT